MHQIILKSNFATTFIPHYIIGDSLLLVDYRRCYSSVTFALVQEVGNVPYVVDNGAGVFFKDPRKVANQVARWFSVDVDALKRYSCNALKLAQPEAVFDIVKDIHKLQQQSAALTRIPYFLTSSFSYHM